MQFSQSTSNLPKNRQELSIVIRGKLSVDENIAGHTAGQDGPARNRVVFLSLGRDAALLGQKRDSSRNIAATAYYWALTIRVRTICHIARYGDEKDLLHTGKLGRATEQIYGAFF